MKNILFITMLSLSFGTVTDIDGNIYETVEIGEQLWMAENLKVTHYNDGESIPNLVDGDSWRFTSSGAYCEYDNLDYDFSLCPNECYWMRISAEEYVAIYGRLYNGYAISDDRGVCPEDWHVPNEDDWNLLIDYLGDNAGHELKTTYGWYDYNGNPTNYGTNESGFSALPGGLRYNFGDPYGAGMIISRYDWITTKAIFWVSSENCNNGSCDSKILFYNNDYVMTQYAHINYGLSIRCVQDQIQEGCTDPEACNYDESAEVDDGSCAYEIDCAGTCGGDLEIDCGGVCGGDNSTALSCCGSPLYEDCTDDCVIDDLGQCCIPQDVDVCGVCFGDDTSCQQLGDINGDGTINVIDIVIAVDLILNGNYDVVADVNEDGYLDVLDIVMLVNWVLNGETTLCDGLTEVELWGQYYDIATTTSIDITYVGLTGSIPSEIGCLTNLTSLNLGGNQLTGGIPSEIGNLTNLTYLILYYNQLTGSIPSEIGNLTNLTDLWLFVNQLTGEIPVEVCDLIESNNLDINAILEGNNLINTCEEPSICDGLTEVELWGVTYDIGTTTEIFLNSQGLSGSIPSEIGCLTNLTSLNLGGNQLTGEIPSTIGQLTSLYYLRLNWNQLTGEIPQAVCDLIESNNLNMDWILPGNNLINTCE